MPAAQNPTLSAEATADPKGFLKKVAAAIKRHKGVVAAAAKDLGVSNRTIWRYVSKDPVLKAVVKKARG